MTTRARARGNAPDGRIHRLARRDKDAGQALVITILSMIVLLALAGFVIDIGALQLARHRAQVAADAAALSGAHDMEENTADTLGDITPEAVRVATANDPSATSANGGSVAITQPSSTEVAAKVTSRVSLPFAGVFGLSTGTVTGNSVARDDSQFCTNDSGNNCPTGTYVADGNISAQGCAAAGYDYCEYYQTCAAPSAGLCPNTTEGVNTPVIGTTGGWTVTRTPEAPDTAPSGVTGPPSYVYNNGSSSADLQDCNGAISGGTCSGDGIDCNVSNSTLVVDLNGNTEGGMWQTVQTVPGAKYTLSFCVTANPHGSADVGDAQTAHDDYSEFTGDLQITDNGQRSLNCPATAGPTTADIAAGVLDTASPSCECPTQPPGTVLACEPFSVTNNWPNGVVTAGEQAEFQAYTVSFTAQTSATTLTFNSSTWGSDRTPWMFYGPEIASVNLEYPADALVQ